MINVAAFKVRQAKINALLESWVELSESVMDYRKPEYERVPSVICTAVIIATRDNMDENLTTEVAAG